MFKFIKRRKAQKQEEKRLQHEVREKIRLERMEKLNSEEIQRKLKHLRESDEWLERQSIMLRSCQSRNGLATQCGVLGALMECRRDIRDFENILKQRGVYA